jgi:hypothetical protein
MVNAFDCLDDLISRYPDEIRAQLRADLVQLLHRDRANWTGMLQMLFAKYRPTELLDQVRRDIDRTLLEATER